MENPPCSKGCSASFLEEAPIATEVKQKNPLQLGVAGGSCEERCNPKQQVKDNMNVSDISTNNKSYFKEFLKDFQYQRILAIRGQTELSFEELQYISVCYYANYPPSTNYIVKITGLAKSTVWRNRKNLLSKNLISPNNTLTEKFKSLPWVKLGSGKYSNWKYFNSPELSKLENRIFSFLVSLEKQTANRIIRKSVGSISRLCHKGRNGRNKTRKALARLKELGLLLIGDRAIKLLPPPKPIWPTAQAKKAPKAPKIAPNASQEQNPLIAQEIKERFVDPSIPFVAPMLHTISRFFAARGLEGKDRKKATDKILEYFIAHHFKNRLTNTELYLNYSSQEEWFEKVISKFDPKRVTEIDRYLMGCIDLIK